MNNFSSNVQVSIIFIGIPYTKYDGEKPPVCRWYFHCGGNNKQVQHLSNLAASPPHSKECEIPSRLQTKRAVAKRHLYAVQTHSLDLHLTPC